MIRTAIPFGYFFIALFLFAALVAGIAILAWGWQRSRRARLLGISLIGLVLAVVAVETFFKASFEWNPLIRSDFEVAGVWTGGEGTVTLELDKTFSWSTPSRTVGGTWTRDDYNLYLRGDGFAATMRFVRFRGHYRLMTHPPEDTDEWDGDLGLEHVRNR